MQVKFKSNLFLIFAGITLILSSMLFIPFFREMIFYFIENNILNRPLRNVSKWSTFLTELSIFGVFFSFILVFYSFMIRKHIQIKLTDSIEEKYFKYIVITVLMVYFFKNFFPALIYGGRWDLNQHIAMADRFLSGKGFYYSPVEASSPYFPGLGFLSVIIGKIFYPIRDYMLLTIASLTGTALIGILIWLSIRFTKERLCSLFFVSCLMLRGFEFYQDYMREFKPDSLILIFAFLLVKIIDKMEEKENSIAIKNLAIIFILAFFMNLTKQHALYVNFALGVYLVFSKEMTLRRRMLILGTLVASGMPAVLVIFSIPNLKLLAIDNLKNMPYWPLNDIAAQMTWTILSNKFFFVFITIFAIQIFMKKITFDKLKTKWFTVAILFAFFQILGGMKSGGNGGNYEVGMIPLIPFAAISFASFCSQFKEDFFNVYLKKIFIFLLFAMLLAQAFSIARKPHALKEAIDQNKAASAYLSKKFGTEKMMYFSNDYMLLSRSTVEPAFDCLSIPWWCENFYFTMTSTLEKKEFKYLYINSETFKTWDNEMEQYCNVKTNLYELLNTNYEILIDSKMPKSLVGKLYVAKDLNKTEKAK